MAKFERWRAAKEIDVRLRRFDGEYRWFVFRPSPSHQHDKRNQRWCWLELAADESETIDGRLRRLLDMFPLQAGFIRRGALTRIFRTTAGH